MPSLRDRIAELETERDRLGDYANGLVAELTLDRTLIAELQSALYAAACELDEGREWRDRAHAAETDLTRLRAGLRQAIELFQDVSKGGRVAYRHDIASHLAKILGA